MVSLAKAPMTTPSSAERKEQHFRIWMKQVDAWLSFHAGVTHEDMTDYCYQDAFDRGTSSTTAAKAAYRRAMQDY